MKKLLTLLTVFAIISGTTVSTYAATPLYKPLSEYGYTGVPDIDKDDLSEDTNKMIENAVEIYFKEHPIVIEYENKDINSIIKGTYEQYFKKNS